MNWVYRRPASVPHRHLLRRPATLVAGAASAPVAPGDALITTQTVVNESGSIATNQALQWGVPFKRGAIDLSTHELFVTDEDDNEIPAQFDEVATWDNDTVVHLVCSQFVNSVAGSATRTYKFKKRNGSQPAASALRSLADITAHDFKIALRDVRDATNADAVYNGGEFEFSVNTYAAIPARVKKTATGPVRDSWRIDGEFRRTDTDARDAHLWAVVHIDVWTSPGNPDLVHGISIDAVVMQAWREVASPQTLSFYADLVDDVDVLFSFDTDDFQTIDAATEITTTSGNTVTKAGGHGLRAGASSGRMTTTGTMPSGMTNGQTVWMERAGGSSTTQFRLQNASGTLTLTSVGTGTHTIRRCVYLPYRTSLVLRTPDSPVWTANAPTLRPQLTATEQEYWIRSGVMPPLNLAANPGAMAETSYWPQNLNGFLHNININAGGTSPHIGPVPNWVVRAFINQDANGLNAARAGALDLLGLYQMCMLEEAESGGEKLGTPLVGNNGPDNVGGIYPGMGPPRPDSRYYASGNRSTDFLPPTGRNSSFTEQTGPDGSHWASTYLYPYLVEGRRLWLEAMWWDCNRHTFARGLPSIDPGSRTVGGVTYYGLQMDHQQAVRANPWKFRNLHHAAFFGGDDNPEKAYFRDKFDANLGFMRNDYPLRGAGFLEMGINSHGPYSSPGQVGKHFGNGFQVLVHSWVYALERSADAAWLAEHSAKWARNVWLGRISGQVFYDCEVQWYLVRYVASGRPGDEIAHLSEQGVCMRADLAADGQTFTIRNGVGGSVSRVFLTEGDTLRFLSQDWGLSARALPAEEPTGTVVFHLTNVNATSRTCNLAATPGGAALTFTPGSYACAMKMQTGSATGSFEGGNVDYAQNFRAGAIFCKFVGIPDMDASVAEAVTRSTPAIAQWMFADGYSLQDQVVTVESGGGGAAIVPISAAYYARLRAA